MQKHLWPRLISLLLCLVLLCSICVPAFADFGDYGGDDDYGGWDDDDGGWDWGGGNDGGGWDWGGSDDYDYDSGWSSDSSRSGGGDLSATALVIFLIVMAVFLVIKVISATMDDDSGSGGNDSYENSYEYRHRSDEDDSCTGSRSVSSARVRVSSEPEPPAHLRDLSLYSRIDPNFSASKLKQKLSNLYIQMQQCWQAKDIESLRPYFTDAFFSQLDRQLDAYRRNGITNYVERPVVLNVRFEGFCQEDGEDHIYAVLKTRIVDYKLNDVSGALVSGSRTKEKFMTYRYHLTRPTGRSSDDDEGVRTVNCPNCGAPLSINESAKCPFCGSVVTVDAHDFVIADIEGLAQRTSG